LEKKTLLLLQSFGRTSTLPLPFHSYDERGNIQFQVSFYTGIAIIPEAATRTFMAHASLVSRGARKGQGNPAVKIEDHIEFEEDKENCSWCS
jgi:hypothetical protein